MPPPIWIAEMNVRCPGGRKEVRIVGPTSSQAIRKASTYEPGARCRVEGWALVKRGAGAGLAGARRRRKRRRRR